MILCILSLLVFAQGAQQNRVLLVTGHSGELAVVDMGGHSYVDIESLARFVDGTLSFSGNRIVLSLPNASAHSTAASRTANQPASDASPLATTHTTSQPAISGFSKDFLRTGIEQMSVIREWRSALISTIQLGFPVAEDWMTSFSGRAQQNLRLVSVAASTESDRNALQLLTNEFNNMKKLSDRFVEANKSRTYVSTTALDNDPLDQKILNCGHALGAMAANNQFVDDGSCQ
jgi:hypothetical protein